VDFSRYLIGSDELVVPHCGMSDIQSLMARLAGRATKPRNKAASVYDLVGAVAASRVHHLKLS